MKKLFYGFAAITLILVTAYSISFTKSGGVIPDEQDIRTPADLHKYMGAMKARALQKTRSFAAATVLDGTLFNQESYDVRFYRVEIEVDMAGEQITGDVLMEAKSLESGLDTIEIDLFSNLIVDSVYDSGGQLNYNHSSDRITIELDGSYEPDEFFRFSVAYHGQPTNYGFDGFAFDSTNAGNPIAATLSEPMSSRSWWPCKDRPDDKADSMDMFITIDTSFYCVSNGNLIDTVDNADGTWTFAYEVRYPITTYLFSLAITDYYIWTNWYLYTPTDSMPIIHHVYPENYVQSVINYNITPYAIEVLAGIFGEYPFLNEKYGHANFEWGGAMEHQTVSSMNGGYFGFREDVIVHELAHQWWGDMITCHNWHHIWLNEGFASYSEALYYEVKDGPVAYRNYMKDMQYLSAGAVYIYDTTDVWNIFSSIVYDKGAWVLHMLRHVVGDSAFFDILTTYYNSSHQYGDATSEDFQNICESVSGQDLDYFFDEWLYGTFYPKYYRSYIFEADTINGGYTAFLNLRQLQSTNPQVFSMPIDLVMFPSGEGDTVKVFNDLRDTVYIFNVDEIPDSISVDPFFWILRRSYTETWSFHQIPFGLDTAKQYEAYLDSIKTRGGSGNNRFSVISGAIPAGLEIDSLTGFISGIPTEFGDFVFEIYAQDVERGNDEIVGYLLTVLEGVGLPGDADNNGFVNLLDITFLINYIYKGGPDPEAPEQADPNQSCLINILDVTYLINFLYRDGPDPLWGCATI